MWGHFTFIGLIKRSFFENLYFFSDLEICNWVFASVNKKRDDNNKLQQYKYNAELQEILKYYEHL